MFSAPSKGHIWGIDAPSMGHSLPSREDRNYVTRNSNSGHPRKRDSDDPQPGTLHSAPSTFQPTPCVTARFWEISRPRTPLPPRWLGVCQEGVPRLGPCHPPPARWLGSCRFGSAWAIGSRSKLGARGEHTGRPVEPAPVDALAPTIQPAGDHAQGSTLSGTSPTPRTGQNTRAQLVADGALEARAAVGMHTGRTRANPRARDLQPLAVPW